MKKMLFFLIVALTFFFAVNQAVGQRWEKTVSYDGRFQTFAPIALQEHVDSMETKLGTIIQHSHFAQAPTGNETNQVYMVQWYDFPEGGIHEDSTELLPDFFNATVEGAVYNVNGELAYQGASNYGNHPGWVWRINYLNNQASIKSWFIIRENRCYLIQVVGHKEGSLNEDVDKFLESFSLL